MLYRTERLLLREFTAADWPAMLAYHQDPRYLRHYPDEQGTEAEVRRLVQMFVDWQHEQPRGKFQWAVLLPPDEQLIGNCGIRRRSPDAREADIGFALSPEHWGRGYATELAAALLQFGFVELGLHRITARCVAANTASARVLEKVGMQREGRLRENEWIRGRWWDTLLYGILESEWPGAPPSEAVPLEETGEQTGRSAPPSSPRQENDSTPPPPTPPRTPPRGRRRPPRP